MGSALGGTLEKPRASILKPMLTLDRHIWLRVIKGYVLVMAILLSIFSLMAFVNELDMVGRGTYGIADAALNVLLTAPGRIVELAPVTALLGSIIGLGELAAGHELIARWFVWIADHKQHSRGQGLHLFSFQHDQQQQRCFSVV